MTTILLDLDGICADFLGAFAGWAKALYEIDLDLTKQATWDFTGFTDVESQSPGTLEKLMRHIDRDPTFWEGLDLISPEIPKIISGWLREGAEIQIVTACNVDVYAPKIRWVEKHLPMVGRKRVISAHDKWHVQGDVLIEDNPNTLRRYRAKWPEAKLASVRHPFHNAAELPFVYLADDSSNGVAAWRAIRDRVHEWIIEGKLTAALRSDGTRCHLCGGVDRFICGHFVGAGAL